MDTIFGLSMNVLMVVMLALSALVLVAVAFFGWRKPILLHLALRNIPRRRSETALIILGLMLATLLITAAFGTGDTMTYSMRQAFTASLGNTDLRIQRVNPVVAVSSAPDMNRPVPTFDRKVLDDIQAKVGNDDRIDGWSVDFQQASPLIDTSSKQASGQTTLHGIGPDIKQTTGDLHTTNGSVFDPASLKDSDILLDKAAADKLNAKVGDDVQVIVAGSAHNFKVRDIVVTDSPNVQNPTAFMSLSQAQAIFNAPGQITGIDISLKGGALDGVKYSKEVTDKLLGIVDTKQYTVTDVKKTALDAADLVGNLFTTIFVGTSLFSIAAGVLLIFLIFSMLAAERKSEMGMARAVGVQRAHLTQMFIFEGLAYDLAAAAVGAALGVAVGFAMVGIISGLLGNYGFSLTPHVEIRSLIVAYCLGMLITFLTVAISAMRVSRLNIVAAIRDIPDAPHPPRRLIDQLVYPFDRLGEGEFGAAIGGLFSLVWSLFMSGPVVGGLGILMIAAGWWLKNGFLFHTGASFTILAVGMTIRWILATRRVRPATRDRIAFSVAGIGLLLYWAMPIDQLHSWFSAVPEFGGGIEQFFVGGIMMVAGAVLTVMFNSDVLLGALSFLLGRLGHMRPILKTAVAYPMSSIFRTGMTIAMFALIMFILIVMSVLTGTNSQTDPNKPNVTGGYQIQAPQSYTNPIKDIQGQINANPDLQGKIEAVTGQTQLPLLALQPNAKPAPVPPTADQLKTNPELAGGWRYYNARLVDDTFLGTNGFQMSTRAKGYATDRDVWEAMAKDPSLAVIDAIPVLIGQAGGAQGGFGGGGATFDVRGVKSGAATMDPVPVELKVPGMPNSPVLTVKIIGVLDTNATSYPGLYMNTKVAQQISPAPLPVGTYFFKLSPVADVQQVRRALGTQFMSNGLEPVVISDELRKQQAIGNGLNGLLQGFMALGLLVGVAALGVISTRAVVERRQQIGVLRAIGFRRSMVGATFLLESSFVALLGILIGVGLGLLLSYNMVQSFAKETPTIQFDVPWLQIGGIVLVAYVISLFTTVIPARNASRIYPAEALRYE